MLIPAQYPKVWGEQRVGNKIYMVGEVTGRHDQGRDDPVSKIQE